MGNKEIVKKHIESCLKFFATCLQENEKYHHQRIDELFLLWNKINDCSFVESCKYFGVNYQDLHEHNYSKIKNQIRIRFKDYFEEREAYG